MKYTNSKWPFYMMCSISEFLETEQHMEELTDAKLSFKHP